MVGVYLCDVRSGIPKDDLQEWFQHYGDVVSIEQLQEPSITHSEAVVVEFTTEEAAEEAKSTLNFGCLRGKTCRCLLVGTLEVIRRTMLSGQRLYIEHLDPEIQSQGLRDVCNLFGQVLDCKVEMDEDEQSRRYGFVHYARGEDAKKAMTFMNGMQLGSCAVEMRPFEADEVTLFTGCSYAVGSSATVESVVDSQDPLASLHQASPCSEETQRVQRHFSSIKYHHVEVIEDTRAKLERLRYLIDTYAPSQDAQMVVIAESAKLQAVCALLNECMEEADHEKLDSSTSKENRKATLESFETGNTFVLVMSSEVCTRKEIELGNSATILINFDLPPSIQLLLYRIYKRAESSTHVHDFFDPNVDTRLCQPLLQTLEEAGRDVPAGLEEIWSRIDQEAKDAHNK